MGQGVGALKRGLEHPFKLCVDKGNSRKCILKTCFKISRKSSSSWKCSLKKCFYRNDGGSLKLTVSFSGGGFKANCWGYDSLF